MRAIGITALGMSVVGFGALALVSPATAQEIAAPAAVQAPTDATAPAATPAEAPTPEATAQDPTPQDAAPAPPIMRDPPFGKSDAPLSLDAMTTYGTLGLGGEAGDATDASGQTGIFTGQLGARFGPYFGLEAEGAATIPGASGAGKRLSLVDRYAGYIVGYLPLNKHFDLFAKFGLGHSRYKYEDNGANLSTDLDSINWGVGAQYFISEHDGLRTEVLKETYHDGRGERNSVNISWVHRF